MAWLALLKFKGDLIHQGFQITLALGKEGKFPMLSQEAVLPPNPILAAQLAQWEEEYSKLTQSSRALRPTYVNVMGPVSPFLDDCLNAARVLEATFQEWLQTPSFVDLELYLHRHLSSEDVVRIILQTDSHALQSLPWHLWRIIGAYKNAEIAIGASQFERPAVVPSQNSKVSILAILGDDQNINLLPDCKTLIQLPKTEIESLVKPSHQELNEKLHQKPWDILFFAGHSDTLTDGRGIIRLDADTVLTIDDLKYGLKEAIANGLQIAIFNSCKGLGLAHALAELQLPQIIIMRQALPDPVAHTFLKYFLSDFSKGTSFYQAVRTAREKLQGLEKKKQCPCASWLPIIYQHPATIPPSWSDLCRGSSQTPPTPAIRVAIASILTTTLVVGLRSIGLFQPLELAAFDHLSQMQTRTEPDKRLLVVAVDKSDIDYQDMNRLNRREGWSLSDQALGQLLDHLGRYHPRAVGLDVLHPYPFEDVMADRLNDIDMVAICDVGTSETLSDDAMPPPGLTDDQLGFSDFPVDSDGTVRRQLLLMGTGDPCQTSRAFSLQLVHRYLEADGIGVIQKLPSGDRQLGAHLLRRLPHNAGGYQLPITDANGYQILLNYRYADPVSIPLRHILRGEKSAELSSLVSDRIILIGVDQPQQDRHKTIHHHSVPGVMVHAHMVSQLLDIVLEDKRQLWWWPQWVETLWVAAWTTTGAILAWAIRVPQKLGVSIVVSIMVVYGMSWILMMQSGWIPIVPAMVGLVVASGMVVVESKVANRKEPDDCSWPVVRIIQQDLRNRR